MKEFCWSGITDSGALTGATAVSYGECFEQASLKTAHG